MGAGWIGDCVHLGAGWIGGSVSREAGWQRSEAPDRRCRLRGSGGVFSGQQTDRVRDDAKRRARGAVDDGSRHAARKGANGGERRRFSAVVVAGWKMDRVLLGARQRVSVQPWKMGAPATGRHLRDPAGRLGFEEGHSYGEFLRESEMDERQPARGGVLHDGAADPGESLVSVRGRKRYAPGVDRGDQRRDERSAGGAGSEVQSVALGWRRDRLYPERSGRTRRWRGHLLRRRETGTTRGYSFRFVVAGRQARCFSSPFEHGYGADPESVQRESEL